MSNAKDDPSGSPWASFLPPFLNPSMMNPFAGLPGMGQGAMPDPNAWMKALDPAEIERRINEMKVVEMWLQSQVNLVQMTIQTLTMQKQSMEALRAASKPMEYAATPPSPAATKPRSKRR
jgi:hypothetical protein